MTLRLLTINDCFHGTYKQDRSEFISFIHPTSSENETIELIKFYKNKYSTAKHLCWGYIIDDIIKYNDAGEPSGTAGLPIIQQLKSHNLTHIICIVVRYFGGIKLGVNGLKNAYKNATINAINNAKLVNYKKYYTFQIVCKYQCINNIMKILKHFDYQILNKEQTENYSFVIRIDQDIVNIKEINDYALNIISA